jgi:release factor glutamine methyltransferase
MNSDLLREALQPAQPGLEDVLEIRKAAERAIHLVRQLLAFSRQQVLEPRVLDLNELLANIELMQRRLAGEPVAYLLGHRGFWTLDLAVSPATLIPRPETELLVELALARLPVDTALAVADLGTGSGAIALALASERPQVDVTATDLSAAALDMARGNAARNGLARVRFVQGAWFAPLQGMRFDLIASNPPYIASNDPHLQQGDLRHEPATALASGIDGLDDIRLIVADAGAHLLPGGWLLIEHGWDQGAEIRALFEHAGFEQVHTERDLEQRDRVTRGCLPGVR